MHVTLVKNFEVGNSVCKVLPWREAKVNRFMRHIDEKVKKRQSKRAKREMLPRKQELSPHVNSQLLNLDLHFGHLSSYKDKHS